MTDQFLSEMRGQVQRDSTTFQAAANAFKDFPYVIERGTLPNDGEKINIYFERWSDGLIRQKFQLSGYTTNPTITYPIPFTEVDSIFPVIGMLENTTSAKNHMYARTITTTQMQITTYTNARKVFIILEGY